MKPKELCKRYTLYIFSLFLLGVGVAFAKTAALGVSPISSVPNVLNLRFPALSIGDWLFLWNALLVVGQLLVLGKRFKWIQLLQIPLSFLLGWFTDVGMWMIAPIPTHHYLVRLGMVLVCVVFLGFSIALGITAGVSVINPGEAFVRTLSDTYGLKFGNVKIVFDVINVALSVVLSLLLFGGGVVGTREGTLLCAVCTGFMVKYFSPKLQPINKFLSR